MSSRRKTYDGDLFGGSFIYTERRNSFDGEGETDQYAPPKRTGKNPRLIDNEDLLFSEENDKDRYIITYADLITLLLGLFIILYAISNVDIAKYQKMMGILGNVFGKDVESSNVIEFDNKKFDIRDKITLNSLTSNLQRLISENNFSNSINLEENERGITIHILDDILFSTGKAELRSDSKLILQKIASIIKALPNDIRIEGHTDNIPIKNLVFPSNWHLSVARALNTAYYLIETENLLPEKVSIVGYSEYKPITGNDTQEGRANNRRVDIVILKN